MLDSSPEEEDFPGRLLHQAALWDNTELLEDLLEGGQQTFINSQDSWGRTPLHAAVISENSKCLELLLNVGADPNIQCGPRGENKTPLHLCAEYGHCNNIKTLFQHNADIQAKDMNNMTAFDIAEKCEHSKVLELLKQIAGRVFIKLLVKQYYLKPSIGPEEYNVCFCHTDQKSGSYLKYRST